ncbi:MAG: hypothetical protein H0T41_08350, partial [Rhodobacteraceae bacterium]|nr:hypothetical protein [Paracoccaceae bacterium]
GEPLRVFCIHDADAAGGMIHETLMEATRARPTRRTIEIINLGLEPWEAVEMGLEVERFERRVRESPVARYIHECDAEGDGPRDDVGQVAAGAAGRAQRNDDAAVH